MLPFPRINTYGNIAPVSHWYNGSDIMAYGSTLVGTSLASFNDYTGKTITNATASAASTTDLPFSGQIDSTGFYLNGQWLRSAAGVISNSVLTTPWTIDYWYKFETAPVGNAFLHGSIYHSTATPTNTSRVLISMSSSNDPTKVSLWNNTSTPAAYQNATTNANLRNTSWTHFALVYNAGVITMYVNGVQFDTITRTMAAITGSANVFGLWGNGGTTVGQRILIERYRVRTGSIWTSNFNTNSIYP